MRCPKRAVERLAAKRHKNNATFTHRNDASLIESEDK